MFFTSWTKNMFKHLWICLMWSRKLGLTSFILDVASQGIRCVAWWTFIQIKNCPLPLWHPEHICTCSNMSECDQKSPAQGWISLLSHFWYFLISLLDIGPLELQKITTLFQNDQCRLLDRLDFPFSTTQAAGAKLFTVNLLISASSVVFHT